MPKVVRTIVQEVVKVDVEVHVKVDAQEDALVAVLVVAQDALAVVGIHVNTVVVIVLHNE